VFSASSIQVLSRIDAVPNTVHWRTWKDVIDFSKLRKTIGVRVQILEVLSSSPDWDKNLSTPKPWLRALAQALTTQTITECKITLTRAAERKN